MLQGAGATLGTQIDTQVKRVYLVFQDRGSQGPSTETGSQVSHRDRPELALEPQRFLCSESSDEKEGRVDFRGAFRSSSILKARPHPGRREPQLHGEPTRCSEPSATPLQQENPATTGEVVRASWLSCRAHECRGWRGG
ncbi:unnamed protein product [Rangifer tarandus platyrhynchus]|uniref:Uncharacterized protein n=1 Tax=Rangifer tarandus platyrhynchus TaxID=3082113 RepID=A0AC59ZV83_RANTA